MLHEFGPVHAVKPELVFELAFEGIQKSTRHKSGVAVRFPRMARRRLDKRPEAADSLESLLKLNSPTTSPEVNSQKSPTSAGGEVSVERD